MRSRIITAASLVSVLGIGVAAAAVNTQALNFGPFSTQIATDLTSNTDPLAVPSSDVTGATGQSTPEPVIQVVTVVEEVDADTAYSSGSGKSQSSGTGSASGSTSGSTSSGSSAASGGSTATTPDPAPTTADPTPPSGSDEDEDEDEDEDDDDDDD